MPDSDPKSIRSASINFKFRIFGVHMRRAAASSLDFVSRPTQRAGKQKKNEMKNEDKLLLHEWDRRIDRNCFVSFVIGFPAVRGHSIKIIHRKMKSFREKWFRFDVVSYLVCATHKNQTTSQNSGKWLIATATLKRHSVCG